jgi:hypothetical protein
MHARYATLFGEILGHLYAPGYIGLSPSELRAVKACLGTQYERLRQGHDMEPKLSGSTGAASTGPNGGLKSWWSESPLNLSEIWALPISNSDRASSFAPWKLAQFGIHYGTQHFQRIGLLSALSARRTCLTKGYNLPMLQETMQNNIENHVLTILTFFLSPFSLTFHGFFTAFSGLLQKNVTSQRLS